MQINTKLWKKARPISPSRKTVLTFIADIDDNRCIVLNCFTRSDSHYRKCQASLIQQEPTAVIRNITFSLEPSASLETAKKKAITTLMRDIERDINTQSKLLTDIRHKFVKFDALNPVKSEGENAHDGT